MGVLSGNVKLRFLASWCLLVACATAGRDNPGTGDGPSSDGPAPDMVLPADANSCITQPCDILTACGCPSDQACDIDGSDVMGTACRAVLPAADEEDGSCGSAAGCKAGLVCIGSPGHCRTYCDDVTDCGSPRGLCAITISSGGQPIPGIPKTCTSNCDPVNSAASCPTTEKCGFFTLDVNGVATDIVDCTRAGTAVAGQACTTAGQPDDSLCAKDHQCVIQGANNTCRKTCIVGETNICANCTSFTTANIVGGKNYGFCP